MKRNVAHFILVAASLATLGCKQAKHDPTVTGEFTRYGAQMSQGGVVLPELPDAALANFPSVVRLDNAHTFQVDAGVFQMSGRYRLERDSIFLDEQKGDTTRLAFAGRLFNDTLHLHWIPDYDVGSDSTEAAWQLFFVRSH
jgi:hypothetical protein